MVSMRVLGVVESHNAMQYVHIRRVSIKRCLFTYEGVQVNVVVQCVGKRKLANILILEILDSKVDLKVWVTGL